jgi:hypothetical protein
LVVRGGVLFACLTAAKQLKSLLFLHGLFIGQYELLLGG